MQSNETTVAIAGLIAVFGLPVLVVGLILWFKHRKLRMIHDTIGKLAEKGLPVPPELLAPPVRNRSVALRGGLVLMGLGVAMAVVMRESQGPWSIGLIPGLMGLGLLIAWAVERRDDTQHR